MKMFEKIQKRPASARLADVRGTVFALLALFALSSSSQSSCSRKISSPEGKAATEARSLGFLQKKLGENAPEKIECLTAKAKVSADQNGDKINATANIIWVKDSILWLNVKKFGIEGVRALVTRDSIFILNRLDKTYTVKSWDWLRRQYQLPEGFALLENLVLATAWFDPEVKYQTDVKDGLHRLFGANHRYSADYRVEEGSFRVRQMTFLEQKESRAVTFGFDDFQKIAGAGFLPYLRRIEAFSAETGTTQLELVLSDVEINVPKSWRFEVPAHYERVE